LIHKDFHYTDRWGELIVHKSVTKDIVKIFKKLYKKNYPIKSMKLVSHFSGRDWLSIEADNTSAFNCRNVGGTNRWSKHSYGKAIDINPIENPYVSASGKISHKASYKYKSRMTQKNAKPDSQAMILKRSSIVQLFKKYGWKWGGDFKREKDYQHFAK
jgi:poly-gamma-glutamate synthesis protein (capsule biosynthesis protein)